MTALILALIALALAGVSAAKVRVLSRTHFDNLAPAALRLRLRAWSFMRRGCAIIAIDIRKLHDLNAVLGYSTSNDLVRALMSVRQHRSYRHSLRWLDIIGQWGGDELIIALADPRALSLVLGRMRARLEELTTQLAPDRRTAIMQRTGGLVDGLHAAMTIVTYTNDAYGAAVRAVDATGPLKEGRLTGERSTSGAVGTVTQVLP